MFTDASASVRTCSARLRRRWSWQDEGGSWQLTVDAPAAHAAQLIAACGLERMTADGTTFALPGADALTLQVTVEGDAAERRQLDEALAQPAAPSPVASHPHHLTVEFAFSCPALTAQPFAFMQLGPLHVEIDSGSGTLAFSCAVYEHELCAMLADGFRLHPADSGMEELSYGDELLGRVYKRRPPAEAFDMLAGLAGSVAYPDLHQPFPAPLQRCDLDETQRLLDQTMDPDQDFLQLAAEHRHEVTGIDERSLSMLTAVCLGTAAQLGETGFGDDPVDEHWAERVGLLLSGALLAGSRVMRTQLARAGYDVALDVQLPERQLDALITGMLARQEAFEQMTGDARAARVWSLPLRAAVIVERGLLRHLQDLEQAEGPLQAADDLLGEMCFMFDLGARYQLARVTGGRVPAGGSGAGPRG